MKADDDASNLSFDDSSSSDIVPELDAAASDDSSSAVYGAENRTPEQIVREIAEYFAAVWSSQRDYSIEDALADVSKENREELFRKLLEIDVKLGAQIGANVGRDEYCKRFPQFAKVVEETFQTYDVDDSNVSKTFFDPKRREGRVVGGCELHEIVGKGAMGVVYRATDIELARTVAVKYLSPRQGQDTQKLVALFKQEAQTLSALEDDPTFVTVRKAGQDEKGVRFFVMDFVDGVDLSDYFRRGAPQNPRSGPLPWDEAADYVAQIAKGLQTLHRKGFVHRDLKPENVMLAKDNKIRILDLGLALWRDAKSTMLAYSRIDANEIDPNPAPVGTPEYMSPESCQRPELVDQQSDLYSLGGIFFYLVTGRTALERYNPKKPNDPPRALKAFFQNDSLLARCARFIKKLLGRPSSPSKPALNRDFFPILSGLLEVDRCERFASADQVVKAFEEVARRKEERRRSFFANSFNKALAAVAAALCILCVIAFVSRNDDKTSSDAGSRASAEATTSQDTANQGTTTNQDTANQGTTTNQDTANQGTTTSQDAANQGTTTNQDAVNQGTTSNQDAANQGTTSNQDAANQGTTTNQDAANQGTTTNQDATNQDATNQDASNQDTTTPSSYDKFKLALAVFTNDDATIDDAKRNDALKTLLDVDPQNFNDDDSAVFYYLRGALRDPQSDPTSAKGDLLNALDKDPNNVDVAIRLAAIELDLAEKESGDAKSQLLKAAYERLQKLDVSLDKNAPDAMRATLLTCRALFDDDANTLISDDAQNKRARDRFIAAQEKLYDVEKWATAKDSNALRVALQIKTETESTKDKIAAKLHPFAENPDEPTKSFRDDLLTLAKRIREFAKNAIKAAENADSLTDALFAEYAFADEALEVARLMPNASDEKLLELMLEQALARENSDLANQALVSSNAPSSYAIRYDEFLALTNRILDKAPDSATALALRAKYLLRSEFRAESLPTFDSFETIAQDLPKLLEFETNEECDPVFFTAAICAQRMAENEDDKQTKQKLAQYALDFCKRLSDAARENFNTNPLMLFGRQSELKKVEDWANNELNP